MKNYIIVFIATTVLALIVLLSCGQPEPVVQQSETTSVTTDVEEKPAKEESN